MDLQRHKMGQSTEFSLHNLFLRFWEIPKSIPTFIEIFQIASAT